MRLAGLLVAALLLAGCAQPLDPQATAPSTSSPVVVTPTPTPSPTPTKAVAQEYGSLDDLHSAIDTAGYPCDDWEQTDQVSTAAESGACTDADVVATFVTESDLQDQVDLYKSFSEDGTDNTTLVGPNWMVHRGDDDEDGYLALLQESIGGRILK